MALSGRVFRTALSEAVLDQQIFEGASTQDRTVPDSKISLKLLHYAAVKAFFQFNTAENARSRTITRYADTKAGFE